MLPTRCFRLILVVVMLLTSHAVLGQSNDADLLSALKGKPLFLSGMWNGDKLIFSADGTPEETYKRASFTQAGFDIDRVKRKDDRFILNGWRVALAFDRKGAVKRIRSGNLTIEIRAPAGTDVHAAVQKIFAANLDELYPHLPYYWQPYVRDHLLSAGTARDSASAAEKSPPDVGSIHHVGGRVNPPVVLHTVEPQPTTMARDMLFSGIAEIYFWVGEDGTLSHFRIARPAGLGLDEQALLAVAQYKFKPATLDGKPVKVDLYVAVDFQM